jgi:Fic family protein
MYSPKYFITNKILKNIGAIEAAKEVVENAPLVPYYEKQFQSEAIARTVHHGTHIEGNDLNLSQTKKLLEGEEVTAKERDIQEVINYRNVMKLLDELVAKRGGYDAEILKDIQRETVNKVVPEDKSGVFRRTQVIIKEETTGSIVLQPPPYIEVPFLIEDFFKWINSENAKDVHPILLAGIAHYTLVAIHPFIEGNGRTVRAFSNLIMMREGYDIKRFCSLEEHFDSDLAAYYEAFAQVDKQSRNIAERDLTVWMEYFTEVVAIELGKIKDRVRKLSVDNKIKNKLGEQVALTERQMKLVEYISENGSAVMLELREIFKMVSEDTILRDLTDLLNKGIVKKEGKTKASRYMIVSN